MLPEPEVVSYPTLLNLPSPSLIGYSKESTIAEKLEAMVSLGQLNSRMKDYYDIWFLSQRFDFAGEQISAAIRSTFDRRGTDLTADPVVLSEAFGNDPSKISLWKAFLTRSHLDDAPMDFSAVLSDLRAFLLPILKHIVNEEALHQYWPAKGPWKKTR